MIYIGVVEEKDSDPLRTGRCRVRIFGLHTENRQELPTNELPWAYPVLPINSASNSGIGISPTGLLNGSWVTIDFNVDDEFKQQPFITGSIPGIPVSDPTSYTPRSYDPAPNLVDKDIGSVLTDSSGNPVVDSSGNPVSTGTSSLTSNASDLLLSDAGKKFIKSEEALSSLVAGVNKYTKNGDSLPAGTPIYAYKDSVGYWTIGYGNRFLENGSEVNSSTVITRARADALFDKKIRDEFEPGVRRIVKVPVTQSMFDALVSMAYNMGVSGLSRTEMMGELNSGRYEVAAALIPSTKASGLADRRLAEKTLFSSMGFPDKDGQGVTPAPEKTLSDAKANSAATGVPIGAGTTTTNSQDATGFRDSSGKYPRFIDEQDTSRLARRQSESETILDKKESARVTGVVTGGGSTWSQPKIPYVAAYPYNHIRVTESGHLEEFDDTRGAERIHRYHTSGTYEEIDSNGTRVNRIVGDAYEIFERNGHVLIKGNVNITVVGDANVRVQNNANIDVLGDFNANVTGKFNLSAKGDIQMKTAGKFAVQAVGKTSLEGETIHLNSGNAVDLKTPSEAATGTVTFAPLATPTRYAELNGVYETPADGDNSTFMAQHSSKFDPEEKTPAETTKTESTPVPKNAVASLVECELLKDSDINAAYQLSPLFTLGDMLQRGKSGYPSGLNYGLTASQIVCNLKNLAVNCLDPIKARYPNMFITSAWRSQAYNTSIGGSRTSDHLTGCAADIQLNGFTRQQYYEAAIEIQKLLPAYRQIILEYRGSSTWIHVAYKADGNKNEILTMDATSNTVIGRGKFVLAK